MFTKYLQNLSAWGEKGFNTDIMNIQLSLRKRISPVFSSESSPKGPALAKPDASPQSETV